MRQFCSVLALSLFALTATPTFAADPPPEAPMVELDKSNKARSKYLSLHKRLNQLREQALDEQGKKMVNTLKSANKDLDAVEKRDAALDLSAERAELDAFAAITDDLVAKAEMERARDKALKKLDQQIGRVEALVKSAARSKVKPEKFDTAIAKAEDALASVVEADPNFDLTDRRAVLNGFPDGYAQAAQTYAFSGQYKIIDKRLAEFARTLDSTEKSKTVISGFTENQIEAGESLWPKAAQKSRAVVADVFATARSEHPEIDLTEQEATLAELDAQAEALERDVTQIGLDGYFGELFEQLDERTASLSQGRGGSYLPSEESLRQEESNVDAIAGLMQQSASAYPDADMSGLDERYGAARGDFDAVIADLRKRGEARAYFAEASDKLEVLGTSDTLDLTYYGNGLLLSGVESLDVPALRARIAEEGGSVGTGRDGNAIEYFSRIEGRMADGSYIATVKDFLKGTNDPSRDLTQRLEVAGQAERFARIGLKFRPDDADHQSLLEEVSARQTALTDEQGARVASATTGAFHTANIDSIVFHTRPLEIGAEDPSAISDTFEAGVPIYGTAYLSQSVKALSFNPSEAERVFITAKISGESCGSSGWVNGVTLEATGKTVLPFSLVPGLDGHEYEDGNDAQLRFLECQQRNATLGEQEVEVTLGLRDAKMTNDEPLRGRFMLAYDADAASRIEPILAGLTEKQIGAARMPEAKLTDAALEAVMLRNAEVVDGEPIRAVLDNANWSVQKNELDLPTAKVMFGYIAVKTSEGRCFKYRAYIEAQYSGGGTYGAPFHDGIASSAKEMRCENVAE